MGFKRALWIVHHSNWSAERGTAAPAPGCSLAVLLVSDWCSQGFTQPPARPVLRGMMPLNQMMSPDKIDEFPNTKPFLQVHTSLRAWPLWSSLLGIYSLLVKHFTNILFFYPDEERYFFNNWTLSYCLFHGSRNAIHNTKLLVMVREEMKLYQSLWTKRKRLYKNNMLRYSLQRNSGESAREQTARFALQSSAMTPCSCEEQPSWRAQMEMRAAAHAAWGVTKSSEAKDTKYIAFNALSSTFNTLDSFYTVLSALSERWYIGEAR